LDQQLHRGAVYHTASIRSIHSPQCDIGRNNSACRSLRRCSSSIIIHREMESSESATTLHDCRYRRRTATSSKAICVIAQGWNRLIQLLWMVQMARQRCLHHATQSALQSDRRSRRRVKQGTLQLLMFQHRNELLLNLLVHRQALHSKQSAEESTATRRPITDQAGHYRN